PSFLLSFPTRRSSDLFQKSSKAVIKRVIPWLSAALVCRPGMNRKYGRYLKKFGVRWFNDTVDIHFVREERALQLGYIDAKEKGRSEEHTSELQSRENL